MCVEAEQRVFLLTHITLVQRGSPWAGGSVVKNSPVSAGARGGSVRSLGREDSLEAFSDAGAHVTYARE